MKTLKIEITGEIWGGDSLSSIANMASNIGLKGVLDKEKNTLLIEVQGEDGGLDELLNWCHKGSFMKSIQEMSYKYFETENSFDKFEIKNKSLFEKAVESIKNVSGKKINFDSLDLNFNKVPKHITIIPDGNRRWAREKNWHPWVGHMQIVKNKNRLFDMFDVAQKIGVEYVTFWAFSTDNWKRDGKEVDMLLNMMRDFADELLQEGNNRNVKFRHIGRKDRLPEDILSKIEMLEQNTVDNTGLNLQFAIDYGGKDEIIRGINKILNSDIKTVDVEIMNKHIDSGLLPPPDLIIRTGGEKRTSGVMMWHSDYSELYFTNMMFPDFDAYAMIDAVRDYSKRTRRFGGTAKSDIKNIDKSNLSDQK